METTTTTKWVSEIIKYFGDINRKKHENMKTAHNIKKVPNYTCKTDYMKD